jgi:HD-GYP domain-containing protein (c-di-GMP phosphodiesterase class II)
MNGSEINSSSDEIVQEQNHYAKHLAEVNKEIDVISKDDIHNENGHLVVPKNTRIDNTVADRILRHRLLAPLGKQVELEDTLNANSVRQNIKSLIYKHSDLWHINSVYSYQEVLEMVIDEDLIHPVLWQELTVMQQRLPDEYERSLFCAWLSTIIAMEMDMPFQMVRVAFVAGLVHDVGLLHIPPSVFNNQGELTSGEWRMLKSHVIIGHLLLKELDGASFLAARAVMEHHECCDGSGYPKGKTDTQLDVMGQIVGMADSLQAIRLKQFSKCGRNMRDTMPYLHMNAKTHFVDVYNAMCSILHRSDLVPSGANLHDDLHTLTSHLLQRGRKLQNASRSLEQVPDITKSIDRSNNTEKMLKIVRPVVSMIVSSGLVNKDILIWLESIEEEMEDPDLLHLTELELMQNELYWQLNKAYRAISDYLDAEGLIIQRKYREQLTNVSNQILSLEASQEGMYKQ